MGKKLFVLLFLLLSLLPLVGMAVVGPAGAAANEILSAPPALRTSDGGINLQFLNDACDYLADHFAWRQELVTANAAIEAGLLGQSAEQDVILGKEDWLYYAATMDDYLGSNPMSERSVWAAAHNLLLMQEYAEARGMDFLFTAAPNKNTLYPEYMPEPPSEAPGNLDRLCAELAAQGVRNLDLRPVFAAQDSVLYHKLDSHWTNLGAALAHDAIAQALGRDGDRAYVPERFTAVQNHRGDLYEMLYPKGRTMDTQYYPPEWTFTYSRPVHSAEDQTIFTESGGEGRLVMFRDSFGNALHPFLAQSFGQAVFSRVSPYDLALADGADTLLVEIAERSLPWLAERAPILPAPARKLALPAPQPVSLRAVWEAADGMYCLTGEIFERVDADSPIYLHIGGTTYEASPVGDTGFTAYLPDVPETIQLLFRQDGTLLCSEPCKISPEGEN